jgi:hypothetical protein
MATGGAGTSASDAEIAEAINECLDYFYQEDREEDEHGYKHIPENKELTDKLFKLLTPETVNKEFVVNRKRIGPLRVTPIHMAAVHDFKFAKKLILELGADILLEKVSSSGTFVQTPLKDLLEVYHMMLEDEHYPGNRDDIIDAIAAGYATAKNTAAVDAALNAAFEESYFTPEEIAKFRLKFMPALKNAIREAALYRRKHLLPVYADRFSGGARHRRQTRRHRSRRHRNKSRKHSRK